MNGQQYYEVWCEALLQGGCGTDAWDTLSELDQSAWNAVAARAQQEIDDALLPYSNSQEDL